MLNVCKVKSREPILPREIPAPLDIEELYKSLVLGLRDYVRKNGFL